MRQTERRPSGEEAVTGQSSESRKPRAAALKPQAAAPALEPPDDDAVPEDIHEFRAELARRIHRIIDARTGRKPWRDCRARVCRRRKICVAPSGVCVNRPPRPAMTPERRARTVAMLQRAISEIVARRGE